MTDIITIVGNIATAPEQRTLPSGLTVTRFRVASGTRRYDRQTNTWGDGPTNWYGVSAFRTLGEHAAASLHKGERVLVTGRLRLRAWESDGKRGMDAEIDADAVGHDLLFGTSSFHRTSVRPADAADPADPADPASPDAADGSSDAWATPGLAGPSPDAPAVLVPDLVGADTPF